jgi:hypothetical protein
MSDVLRICAGQGSLPDVREDLSSLARIRSRSLGNPTDVNSPDLLFTWKFQRYARLTQGWGIMSDMALRKSAPAVRGSVMSKKHRGEASDAARVMGQTAAVAGISGALLLALKAMVLVAPAVLPSGTGLDALGRPAPNTANVDDLAAPVAIGRVVDDAFAAPAAPRASGVSERTASGVDRGSSNGAPVTTPRQNTGNTGGSTSGGSKGNNNNGGGTKAPSVKETGTVSGVVGTLGGVLDGVVPGVGSTVDETLTPVTGTVDNLTENLGLDNVLGGVTDTLGLTKNASKSPSRKTNTSEPTGGLLGGVTDTLGSTVGGLTGSLLGNSNSQSKLLGIL